MSLGLPPHEDSSYGSIDFISETVEERRRHNNGSVFYRTRSIRWASKKMEQRVHMGQVNGLHGITEPKGNRRTCIKGMTLKNAIRGGR
jgi:hypothetical protein